MNLTITVDDEILRRARIRALQQGTSVNASTDQQLVNQAIQSSRRFKVAVWDALIIEAARAAGCTTVLSEDLQAGQDFDGVKVENPFA